MGTYEIIFLSGDSQIALGNKISGEQTLLYGQNEPVHSPLFNGRKFVFGERSHSFSKTPNCFLKTSRRFASNAKAFSAKHREGLL